MRCECDDDVERKESDQDGNEFYSDNDCRLNKCDNDDEPSQTDQMTNATMRLYRLVRNVKHLGLNSNC